MKLDIFRERHLSDVSNSEFWLLCLKYIVYRCTFLNGILFLLKTHLVYQKPSSTPQFAQYIFYSDHIELPHPMGLFNMSFKQNRQSDRKVSEILGTDQPITKLVSTFWGTEFFGTRLTPLVPIPLSAFEKLDSQTILPSETSPLSPT